MREIGGGPTNFQVSGILRVDDTMEFLTKGNWQYFRKDMLVVFTNENWLSLKACMMAAEVNFLPFYTLAQKMTNLSTKGLKARDELQQRYLHEHNVVMNGWIDRVFSLAEKAGMYVKPINSLKRQIEQKEVILEPEMEEMLLRAIESYNKSVDRVREYQMAVYNFENEMKKRNREFIGINDVENTPFGYQ